MNDPCAVVGPEAAAASAGPIRRPKITGPRARGSRSPAQHATAESTRSGQSPRLWAPSSRLLERESHSGSRANTVGSIDRGTPQAGGA